jgi:hypothetical protein
MGNTQSKVKRKIVQIDEENAMAGGVYPVR